MNKSIPETLPVVDVTEDDFSVIKSEPVNLSEAKTTLKVTENSDESIRRLLVNYDIGAKLRHLRLRKKIALVDLGKHTGLSASMLSQLENGKLIPTLPTLARIATVFDVGLEHFFADKKSRRTFSIVRATQRLRFPDLQDSPVPGYYFEVLSFGATDKALGAYLAEFPPQGGYPVTAHQHEGAEFVHVVQGVLAINYQSEDHFLSAGDSVYFDASETHSYSGQSQEPARAIVVTTPARP